MPRTARAKRARLRADWEAEQQHDNDNEESLLGDWNEDTTSLAKRRRQVASSSGLPNAPAVASTSGANTASISVLRQAIHAAHQRARVPNRRPIKGIPSNFSEVVLRSTLLKPIVLKYDNGVQGRGQSHDAAPISRRRPHLGEQRAPTHTKRPAPPRRTTDEPGGAVQKLHLLRTRNGFQTRYEEDRFMEKENISPSYKVTLHLSGTLDADRCPIWHSMLFKTAREARASVAQQVLDYFHAHPAQKIFSSDECKDLSDLGVKFKDGALKLRAQGKEEDFRIYAETVAGYFGIEDLLNPAGKPPFYQPSFQYKQVLTAADLAARSNVPPAFIAAVEALEHNEESEQEQLRTPAAESVGGDSDDSGGGVVLASGRHHGSAPNDNAVDAQSDTVSMSHEDQEELIRLSKKFAIWTSYLPEDERLLSGNHLAEYAGLGKRSDHLEKRFANASVQTEAVESREAGTSTTLDSAADINERSSTASRNLEAQEMGRDASKLYSPNPATDPEEAMGSQLVLTPQAKFSFSTLVDSIWDGNFDKPLLSYIQPSYPQPFPSTQLPANPQPISVDSQLDQSVQIEASRQNVLSAPHPSSTGDNFTPGGSSIQGQSFMENAALTQNPWAMHSSSATQNLASTQNPWSIHNSSLMHNSSSMHNLSSMQNPLPTETLSAQGSSSNRSHAPMQINAPAQANASIPANFSAQISSPKAEDTTMEGVEDDVLIQDLASSLATAFSTQSAPLMSASQSSGKTQAHGSVRAAPDGRQRSTPSGIPSIDPDPDDPPYVKNLKANYGEKWKDFVNPEKMAKLLNKSSTQGTQSLTRPETLNSMTSHGAGASFGQPSQFGAQASQGAFGQSFGAFETSSQGLQNRTVFGSGFYPSTPVPPTGPFATYNSPMTGSFGFGSPSPAFGASQQGGPAQSFNHFGTPNQSQQVQPRQGPAQSFNPFETHSQTPQTQRPILRPKSKLKLTNNGGSGMGKQ